MKEIIKNGADGETITSVTVNMKEIRKIGYELGYGCTMGVFCAMGIVGIGIGILKTFKRHSDRKACAEVEVEEAEE